MVGPLLILAAAYGAKKMGLLKGGGKKLFDTSKGPVRDAVTGLGTGALLNVADKKFLGGRLQMMGIPIPFAPAVNGKAMTFNGTDGIAYYATSGTKLDKRSLIKGLTIVAIKKVAEAYNWIDPVEVSAGGGSMSVSYTGTSPYGSGGVS